MAKRVPGKKSLDAFMSAIRGKERIAGIVIEETRVRIAELVPQEGKAPAVVAEGAVPLPAGVLSAGKLAQPRALEEALRKAAREAKPAPPTAHSVILSLPVLPLFAKTVSVPEQTLSEDIASMLKLESESILPVAPEEAYIDWQEVTHRPGEGSDLPREYVVLAARRQDVDPYLQAAKAAGFSVVATEPLVLSCARGLKQDPARPSFIGYLFSDALLAAAIEGDTVRFPHHVIIDAQTSQERARIAAKELATLIRFLKAEDQEKHMGTRRLLLDGAVDEATVAEVRTLEDLGVSVSFASIEHELSKAAIRGASLRGIIPRSQDRFVSLMSVHTQEAWRQSVSDFFLKIAGNAMVAGALISALIFTGTLAIVSVQERTARETASRVGSVEATELLSQARRFNSAVAAATQAFSQFGKGTDIGEKLSCIEQTMRGDGISIRTIEIPQDIAVSVEGFAATQEAYIALHDRMNASGVFLTKVAPRLNVPETNIPFNLPPLELISPLPESCAGQ